MSKPKIIQNIEDNTNEIAILSGAGGNVEKANKSALDITNTNVSTHIADMTKHVTKDSVVNIGLNADMVDGKNATDFATSAQGILATNALPISGGTLTGIAIAQNNTSYTVAQMHNVILSTSDAVIGSMGNGDLWIKYV